MNARTGELSLDGAWGIDVNVPANPSVAMLNGYNGAALPSKAWADTVGRPLLLGFESAVDRAFAGAQAGWADGDFSAGVYDRWGYPLECGSWVCAHDGNSTPSWALANIAAYGERYGNALASHGRTAPITVYGENDAVDAFIQGLNAAGLVGLRWLVGTWGNGEGGGPNQPPAQSVADQLQSGNSGGPYPATDLDWLYVPVATFAPYGLAPAPPKPTPEDDEMWTLTAGPAQGGRFNVLTDPTGKKAGEWLGGELDGIGFSVAAKAAIPSGTKLVGFGNDTPVGGPWYTFLDNLAGKPAPGGGGVVVDEEAIATKVADKLAQRLAT